LEEANLHIQIDTLYGRSYNKYGGKIAGYKLRFPFFVSGPFTTKGGKKW